MRRFIALGVGWLLLLSVSAGVGGLAAALYRLWSRSRLAAGSLLPFPASPTSTAAIAVGAVAVGIFLRVAFVSHLSLPFTDDEVTLITPAFALTGTLRDFADSIRGVPYGAVHPHEMMGVLYLYLLRGSLAAFSTSTVIVCTVCAAVVTPIPCPMILLPRVSTGTTA